MAEPVFFFGAMSPYSWFAAERIGALIPCVRWEAVFAGAVFRAAGRSSWGLGEQRAAGLADCEQRARAHGLGRICWPDPWPTNDVLIARAITFLAAQPDGDAGGQARAREFALTAMRAAFRDGLDLSNARCLRQDARVPPALAPRPRDQTSGSSRPFCSSIASRLLAAPRGTICAALHAMGLFARPHIPGPDDVQCLR